MYICKDTNETVSTYKEYLNTRHWKNVRNKMFNSKYSYSCYCCNSKEKLQLHHKTYKRVGNEKLNDLIWLCEKCHSETHKINKSGVNLWKSARVYRKKCEKKTRR